MATGDSLGQLPLQPCWKQTSSGTDSAWATGTGSSRQDLVCHRTVKWGQSAADQQHRAHAALLSYLAITLRHQSQVAKARWSQEQTPSFLIARSCFCPADSYALSHPASMECSQGPGASSRDRQGIAQAQSTHVKQSHRCHVGSSQFSLSPRADKHEFWSSCTQLPKHQKYKYLSERLQAM